MDLHLPAAGRPATHGAGLTCTNTVTHNNKKRLRFEIKIESEFFQFLCHKNPGQLLLSDSIRKVWIDRDTDTHTTQTKVFGAHPAESGCGMRLGETVLLSRTTEAKQKWKMVEGMKVDEEKKVLELGGGSQLARGISISGVDGRTRSSVVYQGKSGVNFFFLVFWNGSLCARPSFSRLFQFFSQTNWAKTFCQEWKGGQTQWQHHATELMG